MPETSEYMTTREVAALMRVKERKIYDLVARSNIPFSKTTGKLLFPKDAVMAWINKDIVSAGNGQLTITGSHDPLFETVLRQTGVDIATIWNGSSAGLERVACGQASAAILHIFCPAVSSWNIEAVKASCAYKDVVLLHWAERKRGLVMTPSVAPHVTSLSAIHSYRLSQRQVGAGAQILFDYLLSEAGIEKDQLDLTATCHTELESVLNLVEGQADIAFGLQHFAAKYNLAFLPLITETVDILIDRKMVFEPAFQALLGFCGTDDFAELAGGFDGYSTAGLGQVKFNA
jgi:excisionase family DNA binding protein